MANTAQRTLSYNLHAIRGGSFLYYSLLNLGFLKQHLKALISKAPIAPKFAISLLILLGPIDVAFMTKVEGGRSFLDKELAMAPRPLHDRLPVSDILGSFNQKLKEKISLQNGEHQ